LRLAAVPFRHEHIFDASSAPRGQLLYIVDDGETIGDSFDRHHEARSCWSSLLPFANRCLGMAG
jgi:hypothetical protein